MEHKSGYSQKLTTLNTALKAFEARCDVRLGVAAEGLEGSFRGRRAGINEDSVFESASLIKVLILAEVLRQADSGWISLAERMVVSTKDVVDDSKMIQGEIAKSDFTVKELAEGMITVSDNTATNLLVDLVGMGRVNALAQRLRLTHTYLGRKMMDLEARVRGTHNLTSAADMVTLLSAIWGSELLSPGSGRLALVILEKQEFDTIIPAALPPSVRVAHKTGELGDVEHDAGIVMVPHKTFALAILAQGSADLRLRALRRVATLVYRTFSDGAADA